MRSACLDEYQHAVVWYDDLFLFCGNGRVLVLAQGFLDDIQTGESAKSNLQEQLEQTQQEFDRLLEMSLDFDENTPFLDSRLKKLNNKIKSLKKPSRTPPPSRKSQPAGDAAVSQGSANSRI